MRLFLNPIALRKAKIVWYAILACLSAIGLNSRNLYKDFYAEGPDKDELA